MTERNTQAVCEQCTGKIELLRSREVPPEEVRRSFFECGCGSPDDEREFDEMMSQWADDEECIVCGTIDGSVRAGYSIVDGRVVDGPVCEADSLSRSEPGEAGEMTLEEVEDIVGDLNEELRQELREAL